MPTDTARCESGRLDVLDGRLVYSSSSYGSWQIVISDIKVIGELTNQSWADDWFICFVTDPDGWYEASCYARGRDQALKDLKKELPALAELGLASSTDFASLVLWPEVLVAEPMFKFLDKPRNRMMRAVAGAIENQQFLSTRVAAHLDGVTGCDRCRHPVWMAGGTGLCPECGIQIRP